MNREQIAELVNLYHLARTALSGKTDQHGRADTRWHRIMWAAQEYSKEHGCSHKQAYMALSDALR